MQPIPCRTLDQEALDVTAMEFHRYRERILWSTILSATLVLLSLGHMYYAFLYFPAHKAEENEILNREKKESEEEEEGGPQRADFSTPWQASRSLAGTIFVVVVVGGAALLYSVYRNPPPGVEHSPGEVEESIRPGFGSVPGTLANPWIVKMYYIRCRDCGRTLKEWELTQRTTPVPRKGKK